MTEPLDETKNQITFYETESGKIKVEVRYQNENLWLSQKLMAELFECSTDYISFHLKNIYQEKELEESATTEEFSVVQKVVEMNIENPQT